MRVVSNRVVQAAMAVEPSTKAARSDGERSSRQRLSRQIGFTAPPSQNSQSEFLTDWRVESGASPFPLLVATVALPLTERRGIDINESIPSQVRQHATILVRIRNPETAIQSLRLELRRNDCRAPDSHIAQRVVTTVSQRKNIAEDFAGPRSMRRPAYPNARHSRRRDPIQLLKLPR